MLIFAQILRVTPLARIGALEEIAAVTCFFAADESSYIAGKTPYVAGGGDG